MYKITADVKSINIKSHACNFFNDMINIEYFDSNLLEIDKTLYKSIDIYNTGYIKIKKIDDYENIYSVNPLYLIIREVDGHIEEKNGSKQLVFYSTDEIKVLEKYTGIWDGIKNEIETINGGNEGEYGKDFMKIKFETDDELLLNKLLKLSMLAIVVRSVFEEDGKFYPQIYLGGCLHKL